jgi:hypothetical protein
VTETKTASPRQDQPSPNITDTSIVTRCQRCRRELVTPVAVARRCGWRCARRLRAEVAS